MSSQELVTQLDDSFSHNKVSRQYPYITLNPVNTAALPLIVTLLEDGEVPILFSVNDSVYEIAKVSRSPINLRKLLEVYEFDVVLSESESRHISNTKELMEAFKWMR